ncbi:hypothetical protein RZS08_57795, partial [Arthrospira platensis SPKY1]|nr:hypothetical protein [Arthrospira platensis SPKY1]
MNGGRETQGSGFARRVGQVVSRARRGCPAIAVTGGLDANDPVCADHGRYRRGDGGEVILGHSGSDHGRRRRGRRFDRRRG